MLKYITIAFRNMWRNKRRTLIIILSISFALSSVIFMKGISLGMYNKATESAVESFTGHLQIQGKEYFDEKIIDNAFEQSQVDFSIFEDNRVSAFSPRLESFTLASVGMQTKGSLVIGVDLKKEDKLTHLKEKLVDGDFFEPGTQKQEVVLGKGLAKYLKASPGDTIVLVGQGYHGVSAAGLYIVKGIIHYPSAPALDKQVIYLPLAQSRELFSAPDMLTSIAVTINDPDNLSETIASLETKFQDKDIVAVSWKTILADFEKILKGDMQSMNVIMLILYLIVGFGVMGTVLMMTVERKREFAIMAAIGMKKMQLRLILLIEMVSVALIGILAVIPLTLPMVYYLHMNPMPFPEAKAKQLISYGYDPNMYMAWQADYIINLMIMIFIIVCLAFLYPVFRATQFKKLPDALKM